MRKTRDNGQALAAFIDRKTKIDTVLVRLTDLSAEHFNRAPDEITWGDVGTLASYLQSLHEISNAAFTKASTPLNRQRPACPERHLRRGSGW